MLKSLKERAVIEKVLVEAVTVQKEAELIRAGRDVEEEMKVLGSVKPGSSLFEAMGVKSTFVHM